MPLYKYSNSISLHTRVLYIKAWQRNNVASKILQEKRCIKQQKLLAYLSISTFMRKVFMLYGNKTFGQKMKAYVEFTKKQIEILFLSKMKLYQLQELFLNCLCLNLRLFDTLVNSKDVLINFFYEFTISKLCNM